MRMPCALLVAAGCYQPAPVPGSPCTSPEACPDPLVCNRGTCELASSTDAADATCTCAGATLSCPTGDTACETTCLDAPAPHCAAIVPSNGVDREWLAHVSTPIAIEGTTTIDTSTGAITGGLVRPAGVGVAAGIEYVQHGSLGVFVFHALDVRGTLTLVGTRPAVFLVGTTATIGGTIDGSGRAGSVRATPGPGGGAGAEYPAMASGCGAGGRAAVVAPYSDAGGGGGGGAAAGGAGGASGTASGGGGGAACLAMTLEPLIGGSGGGGGGPGASANPASGGGGGGALQITALDQILIDGAIDLGGAGGEAGPGSGTNAGGGGGGGSGGALLLEAPVVSIAAAAVLAANGGGGGGAGDGSLTGSPGEDGKRGLTVAQGGAAAVSQASAGGAGGAGTTPARTALDSSASNYNAGGGGGAAGRIVIRTHGTAAVQGIVSPPPGLVALRLE